MFDRQKLHPQMQLLVFHSYPLHLLLILALPLEHLKYTGLSMLVGYSLSEA